MTPPSTIVIAGGGVIGLSAAYYLSEAGHPVTVLDRDTHRAESCTDGNAGMIVPSHFIPLAAPGVVAQGLKWMLDRRSPFYLRPRLDFGLARWGWHFLRSANAAHVDRSKTLFRDLSLASRAEFERLADVLDFPLVKRGLLMLCRTEEGLLEETEVAHLAHELDLEAEFCVPERLRELEPDARLDAVGGVWFPQDCHLDPRQFLAALRQGIKRHGGVIRPLEAVDFERDGNRRVTGVITPDGERFRADEIILAGGAWTPGLARKLGFHLPMQAGKGYSFTLPQPRQLPRVCSLLKEGRVAVTPMGDKLRVAGTMEICGNDLSIDRVRLEGIVRSFCEFYPEFQPADFEGVEPWAGLRPCSPDGLPYVGRLPGHGNVTVASGHAMLGLSLGPVTGKLVAGLVAGVPVDVRLRVGRFG